MSGRINVRHTFCSHVREDEAKWYRLICRVNVKDYPFHGTKDCAVGHSQRTDLPRGESKLVSK
jgi:hypothetical protein